MRILKPTMLVCLVLMFSSCSIFSGGVRTDPFAGDWIGSGTDSEGNAYEFAARVIAMGQDRYRMLVLESLDSDKKPLHVMDGTLQENAFSYTSDGGVYVGSGTLEGERFEGYYKGPVDGTFTMHRAGDD